MGVFGQQDVIESGDTDVATDNQSPRPGCVQSAKRKQIVWEIERKLVEDAARPAIYHPRAATCWWPQLKGLVRHENSIYNNWRFEDIWLDK